MAVKLSLSDSHNANVVNYMRFARYQRDQRLRVVDACFKDLKNGRLMEDTTFTRDEMDDILCTLKEDIRTEFESELLHTSHTNVILLNQLFKQAEQWHLNLAVDIAELENRELLQKIKLFEEEQFSVKSKDDKTSKPILDPLNEFGGSTLLKMEIDRLQKENGELRKRLITVEESAVALSKMKSNLMIELEKLGAEKTVKKVVGNDKNTLSLEQLEREIGLLKKDLSTGDSDSAQFHVSLEEDLIKTKHELLNIQSMLNMKEKELEKKVSETVPFKNLKNMLVKKNEQLKDFRERLGKYEEL